MSKPPEEMSLPEEMVAMAKLLRTKASVLNRRKLAQLLDEGADQLEPVSFPVVDAPASLDFTAFDDKSVFFELWIPASESDTPPADYIRISGDLLTGQYAKPKPVPWAIACAAPVVGIPEGITVTSVGYWLHRLRRLSTSGYIFLEEPDRTAHWWSISDLLPLIGLQFRNPEKIRPLSSCQFAVMMDRHDMECLLKELAPSGH